MHHVRNVDQTEPSGTSGIPSYPQCGACGRFFAGVFVRRGYRLPMPLRLLFSAWYWTSDPVSTHPDFRFQQTAFEGDSKGFDDLCAYSDGYPALGAHTAEGNELLCCASCGTVAWASQCQSKGRLPDIAPPGWVSMERTGWGLPENQGPSDEWTLAHPASQAQCLARLDEIEDVLRFAVPGAGRLAPLPPYRFRVDPEAVSRPRHPTTPQHQQQLNWRPPPPWPRIAPSTDSKPDWQSLTCSPGPLSSTSPSLQHLKDLRESAARLWLWADNHGDRERRPESRVPPGRETEPPATRSRETRQRVLATLIDDALSREGLYPRLAAAEYLREGGWFEACYALIDGTEIEDPSARDYASQLQDLANLEIDRVVPHRLRPATRDALEPAWRRIRESRRYQG